MRAASGLLACALLVALGAPAETIEGEVVSVADGDSFVLRVKGERVKVRLDQIDAPEYRQPWSRRAKDALAKKLAGCTVAFTTDYDDRYGRRVGRARCGGRDVNRELVREGHVWVYPFDLRDETLLQDEERARAERAGLWSLPARDRVPPWEWRRRARGR